MAASAGLFTAMAGTSELAADSCGDESVDTLAGVFTETATTFCVKLK